MIQGLIQTINLLVAGDFSLVVAIVFANLLPKGTEGLGIVLVHLLLPLFILPQLKEKGELYSCKSLQQVSTLCRYTHLIEVVLQVSQKADIERRHSLLVHYSLALEEGSTQLFKLLQTLGHVPDLHGIPDGLDKVRQLLKPGSIQ